ncbi:MAG: hypothetical protein ACRD3S_02815, partial [Terracidiphilus sp.]
FALTPTQRRNQLLGIFYYETVEARERRAMKAIEEAMAKQGRGDQGHSASCARDGLKAES